MKDIERGKTAVRRTIEQVLSHLSTLGLHVEWTDGTGEYGRAVSGFLTMGTVPSQHTFPAVASPSATPADLSLLPHDKRTILLTGKVSPAQGRRLFDRGWGGFVDSAGNASIRGDGLFLEITGKHDSSQDRRRTASAPFTRAGLPVTFSLLAANEVVKVTPSQRSLAASSGASLGTVNRVIRALRERTPPMLEGRDNQLVRRSALEDEWVSAYSALQPAIWPEERYSSAIWTTPADVLDAQLPPGALLGSEIGAARLGAPIRPTSALIHVQHGADAQQQLIRQGRLRRANDGLIRIRPALWTDPPVPPENGTVPRLLIRADLLLEDDPRAEEIRTEFFGATR